MNRNYFSTGFQGESTLRYLGDQALGAQDQYVVGFAQQAREGHPRDQDARTKRISSVICLWGIVWINKSNFQIVRLRIDLLAAMGRRAQPADEVTLSKVPLADIATPPWLPSSVKFYVECTTHDGGVDEFFELSYRNENCYTDY